MSKSIVSMPAGDSVSKQPSDPSGVGFLKTEVGPLVANTKLETALWKKGLSEACLFGYKKAVKVDGLPLYLAKFVRTERSSELTGSVIEVWIAIDENMEQVKVHKKLTYSQGNVKVSLTIGGSLVEAEKMPGSEFDKVVADCMGGFWE